MRREALLLLLPLLVYGYSLSFGFTNWDDPMLVTENPRIQSPSLAIFVPRAGHSYQPIRELSYAIDHALWGLRPAGYDAVNLLLHTGAGFLLMCALSALLKQVRTSQTEQNQRLALGVALLWAMHPINTEAVVWVASRKYGLLACFAFGALWAHLCEHRKTAAALAAGALLSSPFGIVLPALFALVDWTRARLEWRHCLPIGLTWLLLAPLIASGLFGAEGADADFCVAAARTLSEQGHPTAALPLLQRAIAQAPAHHQAHRELAICLLKAGDLAAALPAIQRAIALMPDTADYADQKAQLQALLANLDAQSPSRSSSPAQTE